MATSDVKRCDGCDRVGTPQQPLLQCRGCARVAYCGRECQKKQWRVHRKLCGTTPLQTSTLSATALSSSSSSSSSSSATLSLSTTSSSSQNRPDVASPRRVPAAKAAAAAPPPSPDRPAPLADRSWLDLSAVGVVIRLGAGDSATGADDRSLHATRDVRDGDLVMQEGTDLVGSPHALAQALRTRSWAKHMWPRAEFGTTAAAAWNSTVSLGEKVACNAFAAGEGRAPRAKDAARARETKVSTAPGTHRQAIFRVAQFANHACAPNTLVLVWANAHCALLGMYAMRDIRAGEELTHRYRDDHKSGGGAGDYAEPAYACRCDTCRRGQPPPTLQQVVATMSDAVLGVYKGAHGDGGRLDARITAASIAKTPAAVNDRPHARLVSDASPVFEAALAANSRA